MAHGMVTDGIRVSVVARFLPERSTPGSGQFAFAYQVTIKNEGRAAAQLVSRHWVITDGQGAVQEVRGEGVVGEKPHLEPGQEFTYTSWCMLPTPHGTMHGTYQMVRDDGGKFDAQIAPFLLALPNSLN